MTQKQKLKHDFFLINPKNAAFLSGKRRHPVHTFAGCTTLFMLPFLIVGLFFVGFLIREYSLQWAIRSAGVATTAIYIDKEIYSDTDGDTYKLVYEYSVDGQAYQRRHGVREKVYDATALGTSVEILYLPDDPATSRLPEGDNVLIPLTVFLILWHGFVLTVFFSSAFKMWDNIQLNQQGQLLDAVLDEISGEVDSDGDYMVTVKFAFSVPESNMQVHGKTTENRRDLKGQPLPMPGTRLSVFYLSDQNYRLL